ncbi:MAG: sugar phosphate isomerase/epimerase family protein [Bryobacteraceae bacterium]
MLRRKFLAAGAAAVARATAASSTIADRICLFTDHLDDYFTPTEIAKMLRSLGVAGPDLTVRPGGVVAPERAVEDLPKAAAIFREHGLRIPMISTGIKSGDAMARALVKTAAGLGIRYFKAGYFDYSDLSRWRESLDDARRGLNGVARLAREFGMTAGFHNHSGSLGGPLWDAWEIVDGIEAKAMGLYFDPAQAMIEGGKLGWKLGLQRSAPRIVMIAIKDFVWEKTPNGWRTRWVPLGEGMVDFRAFFGLLRQIDFPGPVSLHIEYDPGGASKSERYDKSLEAAARDLKFLKARIQEAYS